LTEPGSIPTPKASQGYRFSFPTGLPLLACPLLLVSIHAGSGKWWSIPFHLLYFSIIGLGLWEAYSFKQFEIIKKRDVSLNRLTWVMNWLIFFVILPLIAWFFLGLPALPGKH
jgi:hypothetical protein